MFKWDEKLSVGIDEIDKQHQKLLEIGRNLIYTLENTSDGIDQFDEIKRLLKRLHSYTVYHFGAEEKLMKKVDYIDLPSHRLQHKLFVKKLEDINLDEFDQNQSQYIMELLDFVANWITNHILKIDKQYSPIIKDNMK